jgi:hypothetical protein
MSKQGITLGEWMIDRIKGDMIIDPAIDKVICRLGYSGEMNDDDKSNAKLIVTAYNQCQLINKSHPEYVAGKIGEMYKVLKHLLERANKGLPLSRAIHLEPAKQVLAEIERKE